MESIEEQKRTRTAASFNLHLSLWDKFTANVHISEWPPINKFTYLQSFLKGEALSAISGLALTEANYETARGLLQQRFGRKLREVFSHIQELLNLSVSGKTTVDLWVVYDELQTHIRSLEALNITGAEYGVILTPVVMKRLPVNIRLEWARLGDEKKSDLDALLSFLHSEIICRERSRTFRNDQISVKADHRTSGGHTTASALLTDGKNATGEEEAKEGCGVSDKWHAMGKCYSWTRLDFNGRKTQCMRKGCVSCAWDLTGLKTVGLRLDSRARVDITHYIPVQLHIKYGSNSVSVHKAEVIEFNTDNESTEMFTTVGTTGIFTGVP
ncbi:hypothetical protein RRG08_035959 [Elysia crispata]|uniref:Uncharacterized protein n=1 Tax=Elysia crispata TaxID=231223 RepID=A0AAE0XQW8_9GAST|nr:hypothetical protein RRG08_035959 [Elysia crispata]